MDHVDSAILDLLEADYRTPLMQIARSVGVARSTVKRRMRSLFEEGVYQGYQIEIGRLPLGLERLVYLEVKTNPREAWLLEALESLSQCMESDGVIGEYGLVFKMAFRDGTDLAGTLHALDSLIASSAAKRYRIIDVLETYKERGLSPGIASRLGVDVLNRALLRTLSQQTSVTPYPTWKVARILEQELKRRVSRSSVQKRIRALHESGVIRQFTIRPRRWRRGRGVRAFVRFRTDPGRTRAVAAKASSDMHEIVCLYRTGEDYSLFAEVFVEDLASMDGFLKKIYGVDGVLDTMTTIVLEKRKESSIPMGALL